MSTTDTIHRCAAWDDDPRRNTGPRHAAPAYSTQPYQDVRYDRLPNPAAPSVATSHRSIPGGPADETPGGPMPAGPAYGGPEFQTDDRRYAGPVAEPRGRSVRLDPAPVTTRRGSMGRTVAIAVGAALAAVGVVGGIVYGTIGTTRTDGPAPTTTSATTSGEHAITPATGGGSGGHVTPPATPSAAVETLQKELGQLDYYEGPITGFLNTQTTQAITYLQRDAHLPQTGTMNAATQAALTRMLATGNNHMGG